MRAIDLHVPACAVSFSHCPTTNPFFLHINWLYSVSSPLSHSSLLSLCCTYSLDPEKIFLLQIFLSDLAPGFLLLSSTFMMRARRRMCGPSSSSSTSTSSLKREFLKKWIKGLQICCRNTRKESTILERKSAIKLSADVAIAATRNAATHWRRALLCDVVSRNPANKLVPAHLLGHAAAAAYSRRILRRSRIPCRRRVVPKSSSIARKLVRNRTLALRKLVPGGEEMDGISLLQETLDYIVSLRVQVDVMRRLAAMG